MVRKDPVLSGERRTTEAAQYCAHANEPCEAAAAPDQDPWGSVLPTPLVSERSPPMLRAAIEGIAYSSVAGESSINSNSAIKVNLTMRLSDAGLRRHQTKAVYPDHRLPPWPNGDAAPRSLQPIVRVYANAKKSPVRLPIKANQIKTGTIPIHQKHSPQVKRPSRIGFDAKK